MNQYISIKEVLDNILDHPLLSDVSFERAVNLTIQFMRIVGCPRIFLDKTEDVEINNYRGKLPCDFIEPIQVRLVDSCNDCGRHYKMFRHTTDSFHMSDRKGCSADLTYKIQGGVIYTTIKEGTIEMAYHAIATDKEGYPLVPDNSSFIRALELYIKKYFFTILYDTGKLNAGIYNNVCQEYAWAVGQAQSDLVRPTIDQMQAITNSLNTLVPRVTEHSRGFINNGTQEKIRL